MTRVTNPILNSALLMMSLVLVSSGVEAKVDPDCIVKTGPVPDKCNTGKEAAIKAGAIIGGSIVAIGAMCFYLWLSDCRGKWRKRAKPAPPPSFMEEGFPLHGSTAIAPDRETWRTRVDDRNAGSSSSTVGSTHDGFTQSSTNPRSTQFHISPPFRSDTTSTGETLSFPPPAYTAETKKPPHYDYPEF